MSEWVGERVSSVSESPSVSQWVGDSVSEWVGEWVSG